MKHFISDNNATAHSSIANTLANMLKPDVPYTIDSIGQAVKEEQLFEINGNTRVYIPGAGTDNPFRSNFYLISNRSFAVRVSN